MISYKLIKVVLIKSILFLIVLCTFSSFLKSFLPFSWGNKQLNSKLSYITENKLEPNIYFLGSSVSNRQIMPTLFDSIVGAENLSSFNLSIDGTMPPNHFHLLENLINTDNSIDYILMELDGFDHMPERHFGTTFSKYYFTPRWYSWSMVNLLGSSTIDIRQKLFMTYKYTRSMLESLFFIGMRYEAIKSIHDRNSFSYRVLKRYGDGFMYFNTKFTENELQSKEKSKLISNAKLAYEKAYKKPKDQLNSNGIYKRLLKKHLQLCDEKGIKLIFILNPRHSVLISAEELLDVKYSLPENDVIDLADPNKYNELYNEELRYDADHLNNEGAIIFTTKLAQQFINTHSNFRQD